MVIAGRPQVANNIRHLFVELLLQTSSLDAVSPLVLYLLQVQTGFAARPGYSNVITS